MPEATPQRAQQVIAAALLLGAAVMFAVAALIYADVISLGEELRVTAAIVVGIAALVDLLMAMWFFRRGQSA